MDGSMIDQDAKITEAMRQQDVYENAMASLQQKRRRQEGYSLAIMSAADEFGEAIKPGTFLARLNRYTIFGLVLLMGIFINYLFWAVALNG